MEVRCSKWEKCELSRCAHYNIHSHYGSSCELNVCIGAAGEVSCIPTRAVNYDMEKVRSEGT